MRTIAENLKTLRESKKWTLKEMGDMLGIGSHSTISKWESGENHPKGSDIVKLCKLFKVSADHLLGLDVSGSERINYYKYYPVSASAGVLDHIDSVTEEEIKWLPMTDESMGTYAGSNDIFFINVAGTSMNKVIAPGSRIAVKSVRNFADFKNGDIVLFGKGNEFSIKRFYNDKEHNRLVFRPESTDDFHTDIVIGYDDIDDVKFYGKVVITISEY